MHKDLFGLGSLKLTIFFIVSWMANWRLFSTHMAFMSPILLPTFDIFSCIF